jgi:hypothetical protein
MELRGLSFPILYCSDHFLPASKNIYLDKTLLP